MDDLLDDDPGDGLHARFAGCEIRPALAPRPAVRPGRFGDLSGTSIDDLADIVADVWSGSPSVHALRRSGARELLTHLAGFEGDTWQERWVASGLDEKGRRVADIAGPPIGRAGHREGITKGLRGLLCVRAFQPSLPALRSNRIINLAETFRIAEADPLLDQFLTGALRDVTCVLLTQGMALRDVTPEALLHYAIESERHRMTPGSVGSGRRWAGRGARDVLHQMGHFGPGPPHSLQACLNGGQLSAAELVDRHGISNVDIRQLLIDYLERRRAECDYSSWRALSLRLADLFWKQIELIDPHQKDLRLS